jgi:hypothetical protein
MIKDTSLIIIGGGVSIKKEIENGLWQRLQNQFTLGLNYSFKYFDSTFQTYVDDTFLKDEYNNLISLPLLVGTKSKLLKESENIITLDSSSKYDSTLKTGVYKKMLCGLFALSVAVYLKPKNIFLLGFDNCSITNNIINKRIETHFYQNNLVHRGTGKVGYYSYENRADIDFKPFEKQKNIYNISLNSKINTFPKIGYSIFYQMLDNKVQNQNKLREEVKTKLKEIEK